MFSDLVSIDSHLTLIICIIDLFASQKSLWRGAWEHARGGEAQLLKAGREMLQLHFCRLGMQVLQHRGSSYHCCFHQWGSNLEKGNLSCVLIHSVTLPGDVPVAQKAGRCFPCHMHMKKQQSPPQQGALGQLSSKLGKSLRFPTEMHTHKISK